MSAHKGRHDSFAAKLTPEQREELLIFFIEGRNTYAAGQALCEKAFGISPAPSVPSLCKWLARERPLWNIARQRAQALKRLDDSTLDEAQKKAVAQALFEISLAPDTAPKVLLQMKGMELRAESLRVVKQKLALAEKKLAEVQEVADTPSLTPEQQKERLRAILR